MDKETQALFENMSGLMEKQTAVLEKALDSNKAAASTMTANTLHGGGGLWSVAGLEQEIVTAHIRPQGIDRVLPLFATNKEDPRFGGLTGFTDVTGAEPDNACDDAPTGFMKGCTLTARFGMTRRDTNTMEFNKIITRLHRGDFMDLRLVGSVLGLTNLQPRGLNEQEILTLVTQAEMVTAAVNAERKLVKEMWQGTYGTSTEFPGLDSQIATGQKDADNGVACPALDSDVKDFNFNNVEGASPSIVEYLSMLEWFIHFNAERMGLLPASFFIAMRPELWQVLTEVWPCQYNTGKCATSIVGNGSRVIIDGRDNIADRDSMRRSMTIEVNGRVYPVVTDDGIHEATNITNGNLLAGQYASSIYFVPLTVAGNFPVTYREYLDYRSPIANANSALLRGRQDFWSDDGVYLWFIENNKYCYKLGLKTEQRIVLRTPQLAGKIQNVMYEPLQHLRSSDPASPYFSDGGVSLKGGLSEPKAVWNS